MLNTEEETYINEITCILHITAASFSITRLTEITFSTLLDKKKKTIEVKPSNYCFNS